MKTAVRVVMAVAALGMIVHAAQFKDTYTAQGIEAQDFAGKKVAALVITGDQALRMSAEEALARVLTERGVQGIASYRLIPPEELRDKDRAKPWFERAGVEGIVVVRPVTMETKVTKYEAQWSTAYYQSLWGYYGYGWSAVWTPGRTTRESIVVVEALAYSVPMDLLLWGGVSEARDPKGLDVYLKELVRDGANEMRKAGLIRRGGK
jgi:hypothetical protein